jgi:hypothetical protein
MTLLVQYLRPWLMRYAVPDIDMGDSVPSALRCALLFSLRMSSAEMLLWGVVGVPHMSPDGFDFACAAESWIAAQHEEKMKDIVTMVLTNVWMRTNDAHVLAALARIIWGKWRVGDTVNGLLTGDHPGVALVQTVVNEAEIQMKEAIIERNEVDLNLNNVLLRFAAILAQEGDMDPIDDIVESLFALAEELKASLDSELSIHVRKAIHPLCVMLPLILILSFVFQSSGG